MKKLWPVKQSLQDLIKVKNMSDSKRLAFFLPNTFTALNMACGFIAIMLAIQSQFYHACLFIVLGAIFDSVDGRVARMTGTQSAFGEQFDSMSDLISFGVSPALIFYYRFLTGTGRLGMIVTFLFLLCGAMRLSRFNANIEKVSSDYFQGLPIPGAATGIIGFVLVSLEYPQFFEHKFITIPYIVIYSLLMISNVPFSSFKSSPWIKTHKKQVLMLMFLVTSSLFIYEELMIIIIISTYVFGSALYALTHRKKFAGVFDWNDEPEIKPE
jgi:CDP-diacylglycerol---serine O-phosphatidyltransferase